MTLYFWASFIVAIICNAYLTLPERLGISIGIVSLLAFWGLALQKRIFSRLFWQLLFCVDVLLLGQYVVYGQKPDFPSLWWLIVYVISMLINIPYFIACFIYAFRSRHIWEGGEPKPEIAPVIYPHDRKFRRKELLARYLRTLTVVIGTSLIILCLTFGPIIIRNNRVCYPEEYSPRYIEHILEYRRTTIPQLEVFERLFPNYLYVFEYGGTRFMPDPNDDIYYTDSNLPGEFYASVGPRSIYWTDDDDAYYADPNSPVKWRLSAGLHRRYLMVMETDIVFAEMDPETKEAITPGSHEEPVFSLWEVRDVSISPKFVIFRERFALAVREKVKTFTKDEWEKLVEADGDFGVLGIELKKNDPVPDFDRACWNNE
jgi:hypothetical protein